MRTVVATLLALIITIASPTLLSAQTDGPDAEWISNFRLRKSDPASLWRFAQFAGVAIGVAFALWLGHRLTQRHWPRTKTRRLSGWQQTLQGHGLDAGEREFLARLGRPHDIDPVRLLTDRREFERVVENSPDLVLGDSRAEKTLEIIRRKLGWEKPVGASQSLPIALPLASTTAIGGLELNQEVELFGVGDTAGFCARGILVHRDDQNLVFRFVDGKDDVPFGPNDRLQFYFWRSNDAGYLCQTQVREVRAKGPGFLITMLPDAVERQQKRIYVRVPYLESFRYLHIPLSSASELLGSETRSGGVFDGSCEDLSAGGFRLRTDVDLHAGDYVSIPNFGAASGEEIMARVVGELERAEGGQRRYGVQFTGVPATVRDAIGKLVFQLQRQAIVQRRREVELQEAALAEADAVDSGETAE